MDATVATGAGMGTKSHLFYFLAILASGEVASALIPELQEEITTSRISNNSPPGATWFNDNILVNNAKSKRLCEWTYLAIFSRHDGHPSSFGPRHPRREYHARILAHGRVRRSHDRIRISQGTSFYFPHPQSLHPSILLIPIRFFQGHDCNHSRRSRNQWKIPCLARHWKLWWQVIITTYDIKFIWNYIRTSI